MSVRWVQWQNPKPGNAMRVWDINSESIWQTFNCRGSNLFHYKTKTKNWWSAKFATHAGSTTSCKVTYSAQWTQCTVLNCIKLFLMRIHKIRCPSTQMLLSLSPFHLIYITIIVIMLQEGQDNISIFMEFKCEWILRWLKYQLTLIGATFYTVSS